MMITNILSKLSVYLKIHSYRLLHIYFIDTYQNANKLHRNKDGYTFGYAQVIHQLTHQEYNKKNN